MNKSNWWMCIFTISWLLMGSSVAALLISSNDAFFIPFIFFGLCMTAAFLRAMHCVVYYD